MKSKLGVVLVVLGLVFLVVQGISYTTEEEIVDVGPLEITADNEETIPLSPIAGAILLLGGLGLVVAGRD